MIDWARVRQLRNEIGEDDFGDVVDLFLEEVEDEIAMLRGGCSHALLEARMHLLKGSALNLGFHAFAEICRQGEAAAAQGLHDRIDLPGTLACYDRSRAEFLSGLESRPG